MGCHALRSKLKLLPPLLLPQIRFPGAYRCVCVELRITHLAVNAILEVGAARAGQPHGPRSNTACAGGSMQRLDLPATAAAPSTSAKCLTRAAGAPPRCPPTSPTSPAGCHDQRDGGGHPAGRPARLRSGLQVRRRGLGAGRRYACLPALPCSACLPSTAGTHQDCPASRLAATGTEVASHCTLGLPALPCPACVQGSQEPGAELDG